MGVLENTDDCVRSAGRSPVLKCRDMTELSTAYLEGALSWRMWLATRAHLLICGMCRAYYDQLAKTRRLLRGRALQGPPPDVEAALLASRDRPAGPPG
jgi:predicted anti-sigma-YlaC factor YlaD